MPGYHRAPNDLERPRVGKEQGTPEAHSPIGGKESPNTPGYHRAPNDVERPEVGRERGNPEAHSPIGGKESPNTFGYHRAPENESRPNIGKDLDSPEDSHLGFEDVSIDNPSRPELYEPTKGADPTPSNRNPERSDSILIDSLEGPNSVNGNRNINSENPENRNVSSPGKGKNQYRTQDRNYNGPSKSTRTRKSPQSEIDRGSQGLVGFGTLSFASDYVDGGEYQDGGFGLSLGYRPVPQLEIEAAYGQYSDSVMESSRERLNRPFQLVGQVHANPNGLFSPFVSGGYVWNNIMIDDEYTASGENKEANQEGQLTGVVFGAGLTLNIHQNVALELDGRLFQYDNLEQWDDAGDTATLVSMGIVLGF
jgi:opacity protein-like surface antigen